MLIRAKEASRHIHTHSERATVACSSTSIGRSAADRRSRRSEGENTQSSLLPTTHARSVCARAKWRKKRCDFDAQSKISLIKRKNFKCTVQYFIILKKYCTDFVITGIIFIIFLFEKFEKVIKSFKSFKTVLTKFKWLFWHFCVLPLSGLDICANIFKEPSGWFRYTGLLKEIPKISAPCVKKSKFFI